MGGWCQTEAGKKWRKEYSQTHREQIRAKNVAWRKKNPEKVRSHVDLYRKRYPDKATSMARNYYQRTKEAHREYSRKAHLKRKYGLSDEAIAIAWKSQDELCALCFKPIHGKKLVDHCHKTGKFRGLVHRKCNSLLGMAGDDVDILNLAISYLNRYKPELSI